MASIQKRSTPRGPMWRVRWWVPAPDGGRVMRYSKPFPTEGEARRHREKVEADERKGLTTDYSGAEQLFGDYVQTWLDSRLVKGRPLAPRTRYEYEGLLRRNILPTFGSTRLRAISATDVREWLAALVERAGNDQAAKSYRVLRAVLNTAVADELLVRNPCKIRGAGQWDAPERPFVPTEVVLQLADAIVDVDKTPDKTGCSRLRSLLLLAGFAGLRPGELLALRRNDIDLLHHLVAVDENARGRRQADPWSAQIGGRQAPGCYPRSDHARHRGPPGPLRLRRAGRVGVHRAAWRSDWRELPVGLLPQGRRASSRSAYGTSGIRPAPPRRHPHRPSARCDHQGADGPHRALLSSCCPDLPTRHRGARQTDRRRHG